MPQNHSCHISSKSSGRGLREYASTIGLLVGKAKLPARVIKSILMLCASTVETMDLSISLSMADTSSRLAIDAKASVPVSGVVVANAVAEEVGSTEGPSMIKDGTDGDADEDTEEDTDEDAEEDAKDGTEGDAEDGTECDADEDTEDGTKGDTDEDTENVVAKFTCCCRGGGGVKEISEDCTASAAEENAWPIAC